LETNNKSHPLAFTLSNALSKEAQDILKISQDLSNFGRAHAENESQNRLFSSNYQKEPNHAVDDDTSTLAMLLDEVEKESMGLTDDVDMDSQSYHLHNGGRVQDHSFTPHFGQEPNNMLMSADSNAHHHQHGKAGTGSEDLLDELGTLLPSDLDVSMPMEMDYSDWLEHLLPENQHSSSEESIGETGTNNHMSSDPNANIQSDSSSSTTPNSNFFGVMMDFNNSDGFESCHNSEEQRDPLLSSRSLNIFSSLPETSLLSGGNHGELKGRSPSPVAMTLGDTNLLWDFV
jgi:hypothetical protein